MKKISRLMIKGVILGLVVVLVAALPASGQGGSTKGPMGFDLGHISQVPEGASEVPGEVVIKLAKAATTQEVQALAGQVGGELAASIDVLSVHLVVFPQADLATQALEALQANPAVVWAEPNYVGHVDEGDISGIKFTPNDPKLGKQWQLASTKMNAYGAWDNTKGKASEYIAILDTGCDLDHPDIGGKLLKTKDWDFVHNDAKPQDDHNHGSHVAGIAAAYLNNGVGIAGLAGYNKVLPLKVCDAGGSCTTWNTAQGVVYAVIQKARVINMSLGWESPSHVLREACDFAWRGGRLVVASSGNTGDYRPKYPAAFDSVISVASTNKSDVRSSFSTYHATVEVSAPGGTSGGTNNDIYSLNKSGGYMWMAGTSMSAPQVSGGLGLYLARYPLATAARARFCLHQGVDDKGTSRWDQYYGWGRLDLRKLILCRARGKKVLIDNTHQNINRTATELKYYHLRGFAEDLQARGYTVGWTSDLSGGMTRENLKKHNIFIVFDPHKSYTLTERGNVRWWMRSTSRKKLIALAEWSGFSDNAELNALLSKVGAGITAAKAVVSEPSQYYKGPYWAIITKFNRRGISGLLNSIIYETGIYAGTYLTLKSPAVWVARTTSSATASVVSVAEATENGLPSSDAILSSKEVKAKGPFYIAARASVGTKAGRVFVISDTGLWSGGDCGYGVPCQTRAPNNLLWFENVLGWW